MPIFPIFLGIIFLGVILLFFVSCQHSRFSPDFCRFIRTAVKKSAQKSAHDRILELDKILNRCLEKKGYQGTLGQKIKMAKNLFRDFPAVRDAHHFRNRLAHEIGFSPDTQECKKAITTFLREISALVSLQ